MSALNDDDPNQEDNEVFDDAERHLTETETSIQRRLSELADAYPWVHSVKTLALDIWHEHLNNDPLLSFVALPIALLCLLVYPRWMLSLILLGGGFVAGFTWANQDEREHTLRSDASSKLASLSQQRSSSPSKSPTKQSDVERVIHIDPDVLLFLLVGTWRKSSTCSLKSIEFEQLAPSLRQSVVTFLDYFIRDFIDWVFFVFLAPVNWQWADCLLQIVVQTTKHNKKF